MSQKKSEEEPTTLKPSDNSSLKSSQSSPVKSASNSEASRRSQYSGRGRGRGGNYRGYPRSPRKDGGDTYYRNQRNYERGGYGRRDEYYSSRRDNDRRNYRPREDYPKSAPQRQSYSRNERPQTAKENEKPNPARENKKESREEKDLKSKPQEWMNIFSLHLSFVFLVSLLNSCFSSSDIVWLLNFWNCYLFNKW